MSDAVLAQLDPDTWQSLRGSKTEWSQAAVIDCSSRMLEALPSAVKEKIQAGEYKGPDLLRMTSGRAKQKDVRTNALWLRPIITHFPSKTSSVYFIADSLVHLDSQLEYNEWCPPEGKSEVQRAFKEAAQPNKVVSR